MEASNAEHYNLTRQEVAMRLTTGMKAPQCDATALGGRRLSLDSLRAAFRNE